jgi:RNA polymerase sigma-70 factor (ECF subfamily)
MEPDKPISHQMQVQQLFVKHQGALKRYTLSLVPDFADADDVLQQVFLTVSEKADDYELETNFMAWARTIARYKIMNHWRRQKSAPEALSEKVLETLVTEPPEEEPEESDFVRNLEGCLSQLPPTARELVELRYQRELKPGAIADLKNWTPNSVYVALSRARALLRDCLASKPTATEPNA